MLKFLRKYNTIILVVGGVFLMIAFLLPQAIGQMAPNFGNTKIFSAGGKSYTAVDVSEAGSELAIIAQTFDPVLAMRGQSVFGLMGIESAAHYLLLAQSAEDMGLMNHGATAGTTVPRIASVLLGGNLTDDMITQLTEQFQIARTSVRDPLAGERALRRLDAILSTRQLLLTRSTTLSSNEQAAYAASLFTTLNADIGVIPGSAYADRLDPPTEDEIRALFEAHRDEFAADNDFGFSYRQEDALKFEMLTINRGNIVAAIQLDPVDVRKHHRENWQESGWGEDYQSARVQAESDLRDERADAALKAINTAVNNVLVAAQNRLERGENGTRILPDDWESQRPSFDRLAEVANDAAARLVPDADPPANVLRLDDRWYTRRDIDTASEVQIYRYPLAGRLVGLGGALTSLGAFELEGVAPLPEAQVGVTLTGVTSARFVGLPGNSAFVRVLDIRKAGPPASIDEVREDVVKDATTLAGYNALLERESELRETAVVNNGQLGYLFDIEENGTQIVMDATVRYYDEQFMGPAFSNVQATNAAGTTLVNTPRFARRLIELTSDWDPTVDVSELPIDERTFAVEVPSTQSLAIVVVNARQPVTAERLRTLGRGALTQLRRDQGEAGEEALMGSSLSFRGIAERMNFVDLDDDDDIDPFGEPDA